MTSNLHFRDLWPILLLWTLAIETCRCVPFCSVAFGNPDRFQCEYLTNGGRLVANGASIRGVDRQEHCFIQPRYYGAMTGGRPAPITPRQWYNRVYCPQFWSNCKFAASSILGHQFNSS